jgi:hypothetical protein
LKSVQQLKENKLENQCLGLELESLKD